MNNFFANWYELAAYFDGLSNDLFHQNLYIPIGLCMVLIPVVVLLIYYYGVNSVRYSKWGHWLLLVVILCVVNFFIAYGLSFRELDYLYQQQNTPFPYTVELFSFSLLNALWSFVVAFTFSLIIKKGSKNLSRTPF